MIEAPVPIANVCVLCDSARIKRLHVSTKGEVFRCRNCTVVFFRSRVDTSALYDSAYFTNNYAAIQEAQRAKAERYIATIQQFQATGSLMDYGCGSGVFLAAAEAAGFTNSVGVDISDAALELTRRNVGPHVRLINTLSEDIGEQKFDVISLIDSAAHVPNFRVTLELLIERHLKPGGVLFVRTPNINRWYLTYVKFLSCVLPSEYIDEFYFLPKRYLLFNSRAIRDLFQKYRFTILHSAAESDYQRTISATSLKAQLRGLLMRRIPRWINPRNSLVVVAQSPQ